jgi:hypothetical protein
MKRLSRFEYDATGNQNDLMLIQHEGAAAYKNDERIALASSSNVERICLSGYLLNLAQELQVSNMSL